MSAPIPFSSLAEFQRERDIGLKISATFDFIRAHFRSLGQCLLYYAMPVPLVGLIAAKIVSHFFFNDSSHSSVFMATGVAMLLSIPPLVLGYMMVTLTVYGYVLVRLETPPLQHVAPPQVGAFVKKHFLSTLGASVSLILILIAASLLLVIPAFWLSVPAALFQFVRLHENRSVSDALNRCVSLVNHYWWRTFGLLLLMGLIQWILLIIFQVIISIPQMFLDLAPSGESASSGSYGPKDASFLLYFTFALYSSFSILSNILVLLAVMFQYFHLVEKKEGRSLYHLLDQLGQPAPTTPAADYRPSVADEEGEY